MGNIADYFERNAYSPKYQIGDRVFGKYNKIPFIGTVGNDTVIDSTGPRISVHLDLPLKVGETVHRVLIVKHKDITKLKEM